TNVEGLNLPFSRVQAWEPTTNTLFPAIAMASPSNSSKSSFLSQMTCGIVPTILSDCCSVLDSSWIFLPVGKSLSPSNVAHSANRSSSFTARQERMPFKGARQARPLTPRAVPALVSITANGPVTWIGSPVETGSACVWAGGTNAVNTKTASQNDPML